MWLGDVENSRCAFADRKQGGTNGRIDMYRNAIAWTIASHTWAVDMAIAKNDALQSREAQR